MRATLIKVGPVKTGRDGRSKFQILEFALEDGRFAMSFTGPNYRNYARWGELEVGRTYDECRLMRPIEGKPPVIDADSSVVLLPKDTKPCELIRKPKKPKASQMDLFNV